MGHVRDLWSQPGRDGKGNRWQGIYHDLAGNRHTKSFTRKRDATDWIAERERELRRGEWIDPGVQSVTLRSLVDDYARVASRSNTRLVYEFVADNLGTLGEMPIAAIRASHIRAWTDELVSGRPWAVKSTPLARSSAANVLGVVKTVLNRAVSDQLLVKSPAAGVTIRSVQGTKLTAAELLTLDQIYRMRSAASEVFSLIILVGATTGLRASEIGGLRLSSVDFLRREVHVTEQSTRKGKPWQWAPVKSAAAKRSVPLPTVTAEALAKYLEERSIGRDEPLFQTRTGGQWTVVQIGTAWGELRGKVGLTGFSFHDLRHFYASTLIFSSASVKTVQQFLGHTNPTVTLSTYAHLWPGEGDRVRSAVDSLFSSERTASAQGVSEEVAE